jgi:hypothetical protein
MAETTVLLIQMVGVLYLRGKTELTLNRAHSRR